MQKNYSLNRNIIVIKKTIINLLKLILMKRKKLNSPVYKELCKIFSFNPPSRSASGTYAKASATACGREGVV